MTLKVLNLVMVQLKLEKGLWNRHRKQGYDQDMDLEYLQIGNAIQGVSDGDAKVKHVSEEMSQWWPKRERIPNIK